VTGNWWGRGKRGLFPNQRECEETDNVGKKEVDIERKDMNPNRKKQVGGERKGWYEEGRSGTISRSCGSTPVTPGVAMKVALRG